ncbi:E3 ubiquitin-protein ligase TRIM39-like [Melanotaenia boesemani]|uniref:E3 ubiquitin-protein ligase TRIM39-like n=1 Tax=Melanotaenia boesemani TaxID=1250792 RepID=UPI001C0578BE|nr:E3 ubiquitin-protein ligase TRIM39-like [Melanotaenia boesemani]XP_041841612.1 E3 ubiquitin-protein ligase TRIM39-like [Melanotaenia boesemani]
MDEHQFRCPVCLDLFIDPVSTPCGHNFCKACLKKHWDTTDVCRCPLCKEMFYDRPELRVNTSFREMVDHYKSTTLSSVTSVESCKAKPGEVACDVCTGVKMKATKSCLVCMASYCEIHLEPHKTAAALSKHKLIEPVKNLETRICQKHEKILELYCKKEETFICQLCAETDHSRHQVVTSEVASQQKMIQIKRREREVELMIQDRHKRIEGIKHSRKETKENAQKQMEASVQVFTAVIEAINKTHEDLIEEIEERHDAEQRRFERLINELMQEIDKLEKKSIELQQLSQIEDHITLLQAFNQAYTLPTTQNWQKIPVYEIDFLGYVQTSLRNAQQFLNMEIRKQESIELQKMKKFADDITIDPNSAGSWLTVSEDGKEVRQSQKKYKLLAIALRSGESTFAAASQGLTTGRHYWEVGVKEKSNWALGVASGTFIKGEPVTPCPKNGMWGIGHQDGEQYFALMEDQFPLMFSSRPQRVGVFVDYEEGEVSFFNIEAKSCIYTFTKCNFPDKVYPVFDPCLAAEKKEVAPLKLMIVEITK